MAFRLVEELGSERSRLYRVRPDHPLASALDALFREEEERFQAILESIRTAAKSCEGVAAVWLYGSVARGQDKGTSDVDIAVVSEPEDIAEIEQALRDKLRESEERLAFTASVVGVGTNDVLRLKEAKDRWWVGVAQDGLSVVGDPPEVFADRLKRQHRVRQRKAS
ncbi:nucleotidyltransferase domain-containing protein [Dongia deserti]|uniref:nucleotidyltransferase domain-containing protein n=1 Tax=Dongia deserti TaxID=2268030 RepID=UPI0013C4C531|nr:nucleotidyltransferase domain-containing protein [Dongia deserti]